MGTTYSSAPSDPRQWTVSSAAATASPRPQLNLPFYSISLFSAGNPIALFEHLTETYGPPTTGLGAHILFSPPNRSLSAKSWSTSRKTSSKERTQRRMKILLGEGLITSDGEVHKRQRRIVGSGLPPPAHSGLWRDDGGSAATWECNGNQGIAIDIASQMMRLTLEVVARTLFNTGVNSDVLEINDQVNIIMELYNYLIALPRAEAYLHFPYLGWCAFAAPAAARMPWSSA